MSSTSDNEFIEHLEKILFQMKVYFGIIIFLFGVIGNLLNILILCQRSLRRNTCVKIFIGSSITGMIAILSGLISRILSSWDMDRTEDIQWICKIRAFVLFSSRSATIWLIMLATIDRWIVSSKDARIRRICSTKNVLRSIFLIILLSMIIHIQILYCYQANLPNNLQQCYNKDQACRLINDLIFAITTVLLPLTFIFIFGYMTILNIRSSRIRIQPTLVSFVGPSSHRTEQSHRRNQPYSLFTMLFIQVILLACLTFPMAIQRLYSTLTIDTNKSQLKSTIDRFIYQVTLLMSFIAMGMQFYVNTLSGGRVFRKGLIEFFR